MRPSDELLKRYLASWHLAHPEPLASTATSNVYTVVSADGVPAVLKLLTPLGIKDEQNGAVALRYFNGHGAVRLMRADHQAHLLEYADGEALTALVQRGEDEQATSIIADVLNQLHSVQASIPPALTPLDVWFRALFRKAQTDQQNGIESVFRRAAAVAERLLAQPQQIRVLHGDIHHANMRYHAARGWLAFDPKGLVGERTYDAANTLLNPMDMPELVVHEGRILRTAEILADRMSIERDRLLAFVFAYAGLSASWSLADGDSSADALRVAQIVEPYVML